MTKEIQEKLDSYYCEMMESLQKLIRIKSIVTEPRDDAPFGEGIQRSLEFLLDLGRKKEFECTNFDNYVCEIALGDGKESVGAVSHLDVVPEGSGWTFDPYGGKLHDGRIYGRGAVDNKGPLIAVFYACCAIKESGLPLRKKIKHIIGTNEEKGVFPCIKYYKEHGELPECGFVPDAWFPAVYAEKGFFDFQMTGQMNHSEFQIIPQEELRLLSMKGGEALNIVAPYAEASFRASGKGKELLRETVQSLGDESITLKEADGNFILAAAGEPAHASTPELGVNAISKLLCLLEKLRFAPKEACDAIHQLAEMIGKDHDGSGLGINFSDHTGKLTNNLGSLSYEDGILCIKMNIRSPITILPKVLENRIRTEARKINLDCELLNYNPHFYLPEDHLLIQTLTAVYREMTGDTISKPKAHGGGSYARILNNFVPFGPSIEGEELCFHKQDESISCERLLLLSRIYAEALYQLAK